MTGDEIEITAVGGARFAAYLVCPKARPAPGLLILPEIFNITDHIRDVAEEYAKKGYLALAPDLFWRAEPGLVLPYDAQGRERGRALAAAMDVDLSIADLGACAASLRAHPDCTERIGALGFCLGGRLAFLLAARGQVEAAVSYYGVDLDRHLDEADAIACPLLMHFAERDARVPLSTVEAVRARLAAKPDVAIHVYAGADHAFNRIGFDRHHPQAADLARRRTVEFLSRTLR